MHDHWHTQLTSELLTGREMIRVRMRVDEIAYAQPIFCSQRDVSVDLAELRVDQRRGAGLLAADEIGSAAAASYCFEYHCAIPWRLNSSAIFGHMLVACAISACPSEIFCLRSLSIPRPYQDQGFFGLIFNAAS